MVTARLLSAEQLGLEPDSGPSVKLELNQKRGREKPAVQEERCSGSVLPAPWALPSSSLSAPRLCVHDCDLTREGALGKAGSGRPRLDASLSNILRPIHVVFAPFHQGLEAVSTHSRTRWAKGSCIGAPLGGGPKTSLALSVTLGTERAKLPPFPAPQEQGLFLIYKYVYV